MKIRIEVDEEKVRELVAEYLSCQLGDLMPDPANITIETCSKQNYKATWEVAMFRAVFERNT